MTTPRLDGPFAATRRYGLESNDGPLPLIWDMITLPMQLSNVLSGFPAVDIPVFGQVAPGGVQVAPTPWPTQVAPAPTGVGGLEGTFGVVGVGQVAPTPTLYPAPTPPTVTTSKSRDAYLAQISQALTPADLELVWNAANLDYLNGFLPYADLLAIYGAYQARITQAPTPTGPNPFSVGQRVRYLYGGYQLVTGGPVYPQYGTVVAIVNAGFVQLEVEGFPGSRDVVDVRYLELASSTATSTLIPAPTPTPTVYPAPTPAPVTYPAPAPVTYPAPTGDGGITGTFGVIGLSAPITGLAYQSITVDGQTFQGVRVTWTGTIRNSGNVQLPSQQVALHAEVGGYSVRVSTINLPTLLPGASAPVSLSVDALASDPPGNINGLLIVGVGTNILGEKRSGILGVIQPVSGISIEGGFGV